ncbi:ribonuclease P protein component [Flavicella sp.]|uniref:ribonuclease P protein component n=1 Tax=Flavicella sp. TaxID=2957742 RepID=UPI003016B9CE
MKFTYGKKEKLKSKKAIEQLFVEGISVSSYPLRMVFLKKEHNALFPLKLGVSVPKRKVNKAVDRNRIKRVLREIYRLNKYDFSNGLEDQYIVMLLFLDGKEWDQERLMIKMKKLALKFHDKIDYLKTIPS